MVFRFSLLVSREQTEHPLRKTVVEKRIEQEILSSPDATSPGEQATSCSAFANSQACLNGTILGDRYKLESVVGVGGWSAVYKAVDLTLKRYVAVKVLHAHLTVHTESVQRFRQEAEAVSRIVHTNLAAVYDFGLIGQQQPYIVMELVEGKTLAEILEQQGPLSGKRALPLFIQLCDGLALAHANGIIHRDIKPSNIMIVVDQTGWESAKLVDFGLVKSLADTGLHHTTSGQTVGTPAYMSPEQCMGLKVDEGTDIYALGCCLYESLTGHKPFDDQTPLGYMYKHLVETPQAMNSFCPDLPYLLVQAVEHALARDREDRFSSIRDFAQALENAETTITGRKSVAPMWTRRKMHAGKILPLAVLFVIVTAVTAASLVWQLHYKGMYLQSTFQPGKEPRQAELPAVQSQTAAGKAVAVSGSAARSSGTGAQQVITLGSFYPCQGPYLLDRLRIGMKLNEAKQRGSDIRGLEPIWVRMDANANRKQAQSVKWDVDFLDSKLVIQPISDAQRQQVTVIETKR